jgi:hypothetical protein
MTEPPESVAILDNDWPQRALPVMPGDLSQWLPGITALQSEIEAGDCGTEVPGSGPILAAPSRVPGGGVLFFDDPRALGALHGALELMGVYLATKAYAVFWAVTLDTIDDRYLQQVRIVTHGALARLFKARAEAESLPEQPVSIGTYIDAFIAEQQAKWNDGSAYSCWLDGMLGGDADSAREKLGFGFAVESAYAGVYRLWSRPWLCTK